MPAAACRTAEPRMYPLYKDKKQENKKSFDVATLFLRFLPNER